jgi:hypothetical protein
MDTPEAPKATQIDPSDPALLRVFQAAFIAGYSSAIADAVGDLTARRHWRPITAEAFGAWRAIKGDPAAMLTITSSIESSITAAPDDRLVVGPPMEVFGR